MVIDLGEVLMDWDPNYLYSKLLGDDREAVECFLKAIDFSGWNREQDRGRSFAEGMLDLIRSYEERYLESLRGAIQPVVEIRLVLIDAGYRLYGLSKRPAEKLARMRPQYPFFEWFDSQVISGEGGLAKPDKAILLYCWNVSVARRANAFLSMTMTAISV
jgi:2-haloacid dehalogenase